MMPIINNLFLEPVKFVLLLCHCSIQKFSSPVLFVLIFCHSHKTVFNCQIIRGVKKCNAVTWGKTDFVSIDKESVCFLQLCQEVSSSLGRSLSQETCPSLPSFPMHLLGVFHRSLSPAALLHSSSFLPHDPHF